MDSYIAELDEASRITAVWVKKKNSRSPRVYDPQKHVFDPGLPNEFVGAPKNDIVNWLSAAKSKI